MRTVRTGTGPHPRLTWHDRVPSPQLPGFVSGTVLLAGIWLMIAAAAWNYGSSGAGVDARWNDLLVGLVVTATGSARLSGRIPLAAATLLGAATGLWLLGAPFLLAYGFSADSTRATLNDLTVGLLLVVVTVLGHVHARSVLGGAVPAGYPTKETW